MASLLYNQGDAMHITQTNITQTNSDTQTKCIIPLALNATDLKQH